MTLEHVKHCHSVADWQLFRQLQNRCTSSIKKGKIKPHSKFYLRLLVISLNFGKQFNCSSVSQPLVYSKKDLSTSSQSLFSFQLDAWLDSFFKLKCTGADLLDPFLLQLYVPLIAESLTHTFNLTIISGANSRVWKVAHVLPLHKAGDPSDLHIYCLISKLSCLSTFRLCLP